MRVIETVDDLRAEAREARAAGRRVALVPTMGALHAGHLALVRAARATASHVIVSIFVNPTQFGPGEDLDAYPRTRDADLAACRAEGVAAVFVPRPDEMYPDGAQTFVEVTEIQQPLCGRSRPTHFRGVATVVTKLLIAAEPDVAVFGEKDYQQLALIRRLARDLLLPVEILGVAIVREPDGLALSSRNVRLLPEARAQAGALSRALDAAEAAVAAGERDAQRLLGLVGHELRKAPLGRVDYAELRDAATLAPVRDAIAAPTVCALAVLFPASGGTDTPPVRLIDNRVLRSAQPPTPEESP